MSAMRIVQNALGRNSLKIKSCLVEWGLLDAKIDYVKFILLGRSRTGSNFLRGLLSSHPGVFVLGEILKNPGQVEWGDDSFPRSAKLNSLYQSDLIHFLEQGVFRPMPADTSALGFKLFYYHAREEMRKGIWEYLHSRQDIRILHIKRKNILKTHLSRALAERSDRWVATTAAVSASDPILLDYEACLADFTQTRRWELEHDEFFSDHPLLDVWYEDLNENYIQEMRKVHEFLGLEPLSVRPQTYKQRQKELHELIENYAELKERFSGSPWHDFFEDE